MIIIFYDLGKIKRYLYYLSEKYINIISKENKNLKIRIKAKTKIKEPPKKSVKNRNHNTKVLNIDSASQKRKINLTDLKKHISQKILKKSILPLDFDEYLKEDLDDMEYDDAIKNDKRTFHIFFCDRIKKKQMIANTFFYKENLKTLSIKILLFLLNIDLYFSINGLLFSDEYITKLYNIKKDEFFSYIARSFNIFFYSTIVSSIIGIIIDIIFIDERRIKRIFLREKKDLLELRYQIANIIKTIKKRYINFIFICLITSIISWYYICCFNKVYKNVKLEWIKLSVTVIFTNQL